MRGNKTLLFAFRVRMMGASMAEYPQLASLPILTGPYSRRRRVRLRTPLREIAMTAAAIMAAGTLLAMVF